MDDNLFASYPLPPGTCEECSGYGWTLHDFWTDPNPEWGEAFDDWVDCVECKGTGKNGNDE